ncbi:MAG TPA: DUF2490 domain-containing protein, partial [Agriterribacter sp.]|nr:DUF2490 domain-containing protein [Agriterribacter sp.]
MLKYCIAIIFFLSSIVAFSQQREPGVWHVVNGLIKLDKNWQTFVTLQLRSNKCIKDFYYYEMQTGLGYNINPTFSFWAGMGSHNTYFEKGNFSKPIANQEFRLWQQFTINHAIQRLRIQHRIRVEERWLSIGYRTRFRYRLNMTFPLNNKQL